jgi:hypothetical protein
MLKVLKMRYVIFFQTRLPSTCFISTSFRLSILAVHKLNHSIAARPQKLFQTDSLITIRLLLRQLNEQQKDLLWRLPVSPPVPVAA